MADFVISSGDYLRPYRLQGSDAVAIDYGPESSAQSFLTGFLLERDSQVGTSAHRLRVALRSNSTVTSTSLIGVAAEPASSVQDATRIFWRIDPSVEYMARTRGSTITSTNVGLAYGLFFDSTKNVYGVDLANKESTSLRVIITGLIDQVGDSGGYVRFKFACPIGPASVPSTGASTIVTNVVTFGGGANPLRF